MNTATAPPDLVGQPSQPFGPKRVLLLVFGSIAVLVAVALLAGGGASTWALNQRDDSGYFATGTHALSTAAYALASETLDVGTDLPDWFDGRFATVRIEASAAQPIFVAIGPASEVERYLTGVEHDLITDVDTDPFTVSTRRLEGGGEPAAPASEDFWRVQASGSGTQTIRWPLEEGDWSAVVMNADGSRDVAVEVRLGARVPSLSWVAIGLFIAGGVVLLVGAGLIYLGARRPRAAITEA